MRTPSLEEYAEKYEHAKLQRADGILEVTFHTDGGSLVWRRQVNDELPFLFTDIANDRENKVVILTGAGDSFCNEIDSSTFSYETPGEWDYVIYDTKRLMESLLSIEVPIIGAVNGPVSIHPDIPIMSDIVLASHRATFQDRAHFMSGLVPGDASAIVWMYILGPNRGRYFLLAGQELGSAEALSCGVVSEVLAPDELMGRAWELGRYVASRPDLTRRYTRSVMTQTYRGLMHHQQGYGLALEGLAALDSGRFARGR